MQIMSRQLHDSFFLTLRLRSCVLLLLVVITWCSTTSVVLISINSININVAEALPLSTRSRWIVDAATRKRVKLHCVNWVAHMETMLAEGLDRKHVGDIASGVASLGFNCVRLTWATFMFTRTHQLHASISDDLRISTVGESLRAHGLGETTLVNVTKHNPFMINLTLVEAYDEVVDALGAAGLMVVLDNHVSRPQWCCAEDDGNGFFGDEHFDPEEWLQGLVAVAKRFRRKTQVVGMSLRNELRGQRQSESDWYKYMELGAAKVHEANPNVLVIVSGLNYGTDLSFLQREGPLLLRRTAAAAAAADDDGQSLKEKLVYEAHWYAFSEGQRHEWEERSPNRVCADSIARFESKVGFVVLSRRSPAAAPAPLFVSEFGVDQRGVNRADNRFLACFLAYAVSRDLDWALWALQGSYYLRKGRPGFDETYGVVDTQWDQPRNPNFLQTFRLPHQMIKDRESNRSVHHILYHPLSGHCVEAVKDEDEDEDKSSGSSTSIVRVTDSCGSGSEEGNKRSRSSSWSFSWGNEGYLQGNPIWLMGTNLCLRFVGNGLPVILSRDCWDWQSKWRVLPAGTTKLKLQIGAMDHTRGIMQCLQKSSSNASSLLITRECLCLDDSILCEENPQTQWFKRISTNVL